MGRRHKDCPKGCRRNRNRPPRLMTVPKFKYKGCIFCDTNCSYWDKPRDSLTKEDMFKHCKQHGHELKEEHNCEYWPTCDICGISSGTLEEFEMHLFIGHIMEGRVTGNEEYYCEDCHEITAYPEVSNLHSEWHGSFGVYHCLYFPK